MFNQATHKTRLLAVYWIDCMFTTQINTTIFFKSDGANNRNIYVLQSSPYEQDIPILILAGDRTRLLFR